MRDDLPIHGQCAIDHQPHCAAAGHAGMPVISVIPATAAEIGGRERVVIGRPAAGGAIAIRVIVRAAVAAMRPAAAELPFAAARARPGRAGIASAGHVHFTAGGEIRIAVYGDRHAAILREDMAVAIGGQIAQHGEGVAAAHAVLRQVPGAQQMHISEGDCSLWKDIRAIGDVYDVHITARQGGDRGIRTERPTIGDEEPWRPARGLIVDGACAAVLIATAANGTEGTGEGGHRGIFQRHAPAAAAIRDFRSGGRTPIGGNRPAAGQRANREIEAAAAAP